MARKIVGEDGKTYVEKKPFYKRWWFIVLVALFLIGTFGKALEDKNKELESKPGTQSVKASEEPSKVAEEPKEEPQEEPEEEPEEQIYELNQGIQVGNLAFAVNEVEETDVIVSDNQIIDDVTTSEKFVVITATIRNDDKEARTISSMLFTLIDEDGRKFDPHSDVNLMVILGDNDIFLNKINPGMKRTGIFVFEIPNDVESYYLQMDSGVGFAAGKSAKIKLK